jgi:hypothetical protein
MHRNAWALAPALLLLFPVAAAAVNLSSVTVSATAIVSGSPLEVTVAHDGPVPAGGIFVSLTSDYCRLAMGVGGGCQAGFVRAAAADQSAIEQSCGRHGKS